MKGRLWAALIEFVLHRLGTDLNIILSYQNEKSLYLRML